MKSGSLVTPGQMAVDSVHIIVALDIDSIQSVHTHTHARTHARTHAHTRTHPTLDFQTSNSDSKLSNDQATAYHMLHSSLLINLAS